LNTLAVAATVAALGFTLSMSMLRQLLPMDHSLRHWRSAAVLILVGMVLHTQRGKWPEELTWLLANTLVMAGGVFFWQGSATLADRRLANAMVLGLIVVSTTTNLALHLWWPSNYPRIAALSLAMTVCLGGAGWAFWQLGRSRLTKTTRFTSAVFWLGSLIYLARMIWAEGSAFHDIQHASRAWEVLLPYAYAILFFTWSTAMVAVVVGDKLRERLQAALNQAESSDLAKSAFLASITHELRTPLNAISGFAQLMSHEDRYPTEVRQSASLIQNAGNQLLDVVNDLMDLRALQAGTLDLQFHISHVQPLIDQTMEDWRAVAQKQGTTLAVQGVARNLTIWVDPVRFKQVLRNLVSNAFKFNRPGGVVRVEWVDDGDSVLITVSDTGPGIPEHLRSRIFNAFDRLGAESGEIAGTGIGLAISRQLVQMMGGRIDFKNNPEQGCTFWARFPQAVLVNGEVVLQTSGGDVEVDPNFPSTRAFEHQPQAIPHGKQVLYVEDNLTNQKLVQAVFQKQLGLEVTLALTAEEGLAIARDKLPDLILMDLNLPGMDGYSALKALRSDPRTAGIPIMAVTAQSQPQDIEKGRNAGFDAYMTKPLKLGNLISQAMQLLKRSRPIATEAMNPSE
jgi:signal transduction histidine kinase/CheY-like chemotaxis protein